MRITKNKLIEIVPDLDENGIKTTKDVLGAVKIIGNNYCTQLVSMDLCTRICENCSEHLYKMTRLEKANDWRALLTWLAKNERAIAKDQEHHTEIIQPSDAGNVFAELYRMYE